MTELLIDAGLNSLKKKDCWIIKKNLINNNCLFKFYAIFLSI